MDMFSEKGGALYLLVVLLDKVIPLEIELRFTSDTGFEVERSTSLAPQLEPSPNPGTGIGLLNRAVTKLHYILFLQNSVACLRQVRTG